MFVCITCRDRRSQLLFKLRVHKNFAEFTGKHLCQRFFLIKLQTEGPIFKSLKIYMWKSVKSAIKVTFDFERVEESRFFDFVHSINRATKLYLAHYSCVVIILLNMVLDKPTLSACSFRKPLLYFSAYSLFFYLLCFSILSS